MGYSVYTKVVAEQSYHKIVLSRIIIFDLHPKHHITVWPYDNVYPIIRVVPEFERFFEAKLRDDVPFFMNVW